jgi:hypothetical protein
MSLCMVLCTPFCLGPLFLHKNRMRLTKTWPYFFNHPKRYFKLLLLPRWKNNPTTHPFFFIFLMHLMREVLEGGKGGGRGGGSCVTKLRNTNNNDTKERSVCVCVWGPKSLANVFSSPEGIERPGPFSPPPLFLISTLKEGQLGVSREKKCWVGGWVGWGGVSLKMFCIIYCVSRAGLKEVGMWAAELFGWKLELLSLGMVMAYWYSPSLFWVPGTLIRKVMGSNPLGSSRFCWKPCWPSVTELDFGVYGVGMVSHS